MSKNKVWIDSGKIFEARPIEDCVNDGASQPDDKSIKWVVFRVFTREMNCVEYDAIGYAKTIADAKGMRFVS